MTTPTTTTRPRRSDAAARTLATPARRPVRGGDPVLLGDVLCERYGHESWWPARVRRAARPRRDPRHEPESTP